MKFAQVRNVPDIRFENFSGYWSFKPLSYFASQVKKKNTNQAESYVLTNSAKFGIVGQEEYFDREIAKNDNLANYYVVHVDDFIYNPRKSASASAGPIKRNRCAKGVISPIYTVFHFSKGNPDFFEQYFNSTKWHQYMKSIANYGARFDRLNITRTDFYNLPLPCISEDEQQKIAAFLFSMDTKIGQLGKKKALLEQYKKGMMQKLFRQEIRFKDEQGNDFSDWEGNTLGMLFEISAGGDIENSHSRKNKDGIFRYPIYANSEKAKGLHGYSDRYRVKQNCITVSGRGTLGVAHARFEKFFPIVRLLVLIPRKEINLIFFEHVINLLQIFNESTGVPQLTAPQLKKYHLIYPSINEQHKIADFLSSIHKKIELVAEQLEQARTFKKGLLQRMFI